MIGPSKSKHKFIIFFSFIVLFSSCFNNASAIPAHTKTPLPVPALTLSSKIKGKIKQYPNLISGVYAKPSWLQATNVVNINGDVPFPAASLIKIPIAVLVLRKIDKGQLSWNKILVLKRSHYAQGAGYLRTRRIGTQIKLREVFRLMLTISDNTATNMLIDLLGGIGAINEQFAQLGLNNTRVNNWLGDFKGTNKTSPHDLVEILDKSLEGNILSNNSKNYLKDILLHVKNKSLINKGLGKYTKFAHKTGTIGICIGDAGIIYLSRGKRIGIAIMVRRPFNSLHGQKLIREISNLVYEQLG